MKPNLAIISLRADLYSSQRLIQAAKQCGATVSHFNPLDTRLSLGQTDTGQQTSFASDVVIPRIASSVNYLGCRLLQQLQATGYHSINPVDAIATANDQLATLQRLQQAGLAIPRSGFACQPEHLDFLLNEAGPLPVVIKQVSGTHGEGVTLVSTRQQAEQHLLPALAARQNLLVQQYIAEAAGQDIRCLVVGNQVVAAIERRAKCGEFRANLHQGGTAHPLTLSAQEQQLALAASQAVGLNVAGVDLIRSEAGPLVLEVNASPGLEGIEQATGIDVAGAIVDYALNHAR